MEHNLGKWDLRRLDVAPLEGWSGHIKVHKWLSYDVRDGLQAAGGHDGVLRLWDSVLYMGVVISSPRSIRPCQEKQI